LAKRDVIQSHVEALMERYLEVDDLIVDERGEIPVHAGSADYRVRVLPGERPHVEVYSVAVQDIDLDPGLLEALNTENRRLWHGRVFWDERRVILTAQLAGDTVGFDDLACTCAEVSSWAQQMGPSLAATFGGRVAHPDEVEDEEGSS
jgi:plasmid stability protein